MTKIIGTSTASFYVDKNGSFRPFGVVLQDSMNRMRSFYKTQKQQYNIRRLQWQKEGLAK